MAETQLVRAIGELSTEKQLHGKDLAKAVKSFLVRKRLTKRVGKIVRALATYEANVAQLIPVQATTAHHPTRGLQETIEAKAQELFGGKGEKTKVTFQEDKTLLGGVRLETRDTRYDFSLSRTLLDVRKSLVK